MISTITHRKLPVRFTTAMVALGFVTIQGILRNVDAGVSDEVILATLAVVATLITGDTIRASGTVKASAALVDTATP